MTFAHLPSGYVLAYVNEKLLHRKGLPKELKKQLVLVTTVGAAFPDVDTLPFLGDPQGLAVHRNFVTHTPFLYVVLSVLVYYLAGTFSKKSLKYKVLWLWYGFVSGTFLHLLTDSFMYGIRWLYPVSGEFYAVFGGNPFAGVSFFEGIQAYVVSRYFLPELVFFVLAGWLYFVRKYARD